MPQSNVVANAEEPLPILEEIELVAAPPQDPPQEEVLIHPKDDVDMDSDDECYYSDEDLAEDILLHEEAKAYAMLHSLDVIHD